MRKDKLSWDEMNQWNALFQPQCVQIVVLTWRKNCHQIISFWYVQLQDVISFVFCFVTSNLYVVCLNLCADVNPQHNTFANKQRILEVKKHYNKITNSLLFMDQVIISFWVSTFGLCVCPKDIISINVKKDLNVITYAYRYKIL